MSIAEGVLEALRREAAQRPGARVIRAGLRVGPLSGVEPASLRFALEALSPEIAFEIEIAAWTRRCAACGAVFAVKDAGEACTCGSARTERAGGDELDLSYIELEQP